MNLRVSCAVACAVPLLLFQPAAGEDRPSIGYKIGQFMRQVDRGVQQKLDESPQVRQGITRGIDTFANNMIDAVTPEADEDCRRVQRGAVQMLVNPSHTESRRAFHDVIDAAVGGSARSSGGGWMVVFGREGFGFMQSGPAAAGRPAVLCSQWHSDLWRQADHQLLAVSDSLNGWLSGSHRVVAGWLGQAGMGRDASAALATVVLVLAGLLLLRTLLRVPCRLLRRRPAQL
jgi:hypothetical protein